MYLYLRGQVFNFLSFTRINVATTLFHLLSYLPMLVVHLHKEYFHYFRAFWMVIFKGKLPQRVPQDCLVWVGGSLEQQVALTRTWPVTATNTHGFISLQSETARWAWGSSSCSPSNKSSDWLCQSFAVTYYHKVNFLQQGRASNSGTDGNTEYF